MKELMSTTERQFILAALAERRRVDGREAFDFRELKVEFGTDSGCCYVQLGNTKVLAQVSCSVTSPKESRPMDGLLMSTIEFSPMAGPQFETNRPMSTEALETSRLVERCLKESRCLDTESLCITAGTKVWCIRVDLRVLAHCGNVVDAASIAAISALLHFRRPDVTVCGTDVKIHRLDERDPIPLSVHHVPISITFAFFEKGKYLLVDPTQREETVMDGKMVVAMNKHREICMLQVTGGMLLLREQVTRCTNMAASKVATITELIHRALEQDAEKRKIRGASIALRFGIVSQSIDASSHRKVTTKLNEDGKSAGTAISIEINNVTSLSEKIDSSDNDIELSTEVSSSAGALYIDSSEVTSSNNSASHSSDGDDVVDDSSGDGSDSVQFVSPYLAANKVTSSRPSKKKAIGLHGAKKTAKKSDSHTVRSKPSHDVHVIQHTRMQIDSSVIEVSVSSEDNDDEEEDVIVVKSDDFGFHRKADAL